MFDFLKLWLPILASAVGVFILSSIIHMFTPWHKNDFKTVPNEEVFRGVVGPLSIPPGDYMVPKAESMDDMKSQAFQEKFAKGPVIVMTVMPGGKMNMGPQLGMWFLYSLVVGALTACVTMSAMGDMGDTFHPHRAFHFAGMVSFIAYSVGMWPASIWYKKSIWTTIRQTVDGALYAVVTAACFAHLWPR